MKYIILLALALSLSSGVWACENYEDCMRSGHNLSSEGLFIMKRSEMAQIKYLKAIAFKLDEISKKLGPLTTEAGKDNKEEV